MCTTDSDLLSSSSKGPLLKLNNSFRENRQNVMNLTQRFSTMKAVELVGKKIKLLSS